MLFNSSRHMTPQQTAATYDRLASVWNDPSFNWANGMEQHRRALRFLAEKGKAIDIGCGSSGRIIDLLVAEGFDTEGLDITPEMVRLARELHPEVTFHVGDICAWKLPQKYDFISAWDSIWHAPLASHEAILRKLCDGLSDGGVLIFTTGGVDAAGEVSNAFEGEMLYHAALGIPKVLEIVSQEGCICRHLEYDQHPELHLYLIVQKARR